MADACGANRGEVRWLEHPTAGRRPACILTRQAAIPVLAPGKLAELCTALSVATGC